SALYGSIAARIAGIPAKINAVTGLGYIFSSGDRLAKFLRPFIRVLFGSILGGEGSRIIVQNRDDFEMFCEMGFAQARKLHLIAGSGVDTNHFRPCAREARIGAPFRVLLASRLLVDKGVHEFVDASRAFQNDPAIEFVLAGEPDPGNPASISLDLI